tara:strand:+ start:82 stop:642 length:561 start_codon:yes stop_codon:yes gene_type:complete
MANPMYGQNKYDDDAQFAANEANLWKSEVVDSGLSADVVVTAGTGGTVTVSQPDGTILKDLYVILEGTWTTHASNDLDFDLGSSAKGGQYIDEKAIYDNAGASVTLPTGVPFPCVINSQGAAVGDMITSTGYTNEVFTPAASFVNSSGAARTLHVSLIPNTGNMAAMTNAKFKAIAVFGKTTDFNL